MRATTPIVVLLFDEFPVIDLQQADGGIDAKRFPNFARLASESTWFRNTSTVSASTTVAVPAILTGQKPKKGALPILRDHPNNLFTLLGHRYRMAVTESQTRLCPQRLCRRKDAGAGSRLSSLYSDVRVVYLHLIAPPALEQRLPVIDESWGDFGGGSTGEDDEPSAADSAGVPKVDFSTFYLSRVRDFNRFVASFRKPGTGAADALLPARPPAAHALALLPRRPCPRRDDDERARPERRAAGSTRSSQSRHGNDTSSRSATRTSCSAGSSRASTKYASGTRRS